MPEGVRVTDVEGLTKRESKQIHDLCLRVCVRVKLVGIGISDVMEMVVQ